MIALGSDQGGFEVKQEIIAYLEKNQIEYKDFGSYDPEPVDYPAYVKMLTSMANVNVWIYLRHFWSQKQSERSVLFMGLEGPEKQQWFCRQYLYCQ